VPRLGVKGFVQSEMDGWELERSSPRGPIPPESWPHADVTFPMCSSRDVEISNSSERVAEIILRNAVLFGALT
jgi:hypothetical protein